MRKRTDLSINELRRLRQRQVVGTRPATTADLVHIVNSGMTVEQTREYLSEPPRQAAFDFAEPKPEVVDTRISPNTGKALSAVEAERVFRGRSARMMGRVIITDAEYFACQPCVNKFLRSPDAGVPGKPWPIGPMNYRFVWEPRKNEGKSMKCTWCDKMVRGEE